jgi:hypothetical protein
VDPHTQGTGRVNPSMRTALAQAGLAQDPHTTAATCSMLGPGRAKPPSWPGALRGKWSPGPRVAPRRAALTSRPACPGAHANYHSGPKVMWRLVVGHGISTASSCLAHDLTAGTSVLLQVASSMEGGKEVPLEGRGGPPLLQVSSPINRDPSPHFKTHKWSFDEPKCCHYYS